MTFLNAILALGGMAFSIPLIIHLLNRSRYITIDWGAMQFLETSVRVNARRIQWKQLLLLLIRCLIPVMLALAMARPIILSWRDSGTANAMALAVILDDSLSMQSIDDLGQNPTKTRWQSACQQLSDIADQLPSGSAICMVLSGTPLEVRSDLDPTTWRKELEQLSQKTTYAGKLDVRLGVERGLEWLQKTTQAKRHLLVVSDFALSDWSGDRDARLSEIEPMLARQTVPVPWSFLNVAKNPVDESPTSDIAIKTMEIASRIATVGAPLTVTATVQNYSESPQQIPVRLAADNEEIEIQSLTVPPRSTLSTRFRWVPQSHGDIELRVNADHQDRTPADNAMTRVMRVASPIRVLLVDGARRPEAMKSESDFLRYALTPFALLQGLPGDAFATRVVDSNGWDEGILKEHDLIVCCNVPDLSPQHRKWIRSFLEKGGGALFALGDGVQVDRYNIWEMISEGGLRPGKLLPRAEWSGGFSESDTPFFELAPQVMESISSIQFRHRQGFEDSDPSGTIGFQFEDGQPWIISYPVGDGRCLWMTSSCDDEDSNFPSRPAYLPIMQKLLIFAARTPMGWRSTEPGQRWVEAWKDNQHDAGATTQEVAPQPDTVVEWRQNEGLVSNAVFKRTGYKQNSGEASGKIDGISEIDAPRSIGVVQARIGSSVRKMMIDTSPIDRGQELVCETMAADGFANLAKRVNASHASSSEQWMSLLRNSWSGRELWFWCWVLLIGLVLAEMALQQSFQPKRSASLPNTADQSPPTNASRGAA
jgi:hypothetical protein